MSVSVREALVHLGVADPPRGVSVNGEWIEGAGGALTARSPIDGSTLAKLSSADAGQVDHAIARAAEAFATWRLVPAPQRGRFVRAFGERLRRHKADLAAVVSIEAGKITQEALGEVQEMIDICDFAVGLSRQLYGRTMASERPGHRLTEQCIRPVRWAGFPPSTFPWRYGRGMQRLRGSAAVP